MDLIYQIILLIIVQRGLQKIFLSHVLPFPREGRWSSVQGNQVGLLDGQAGERER